MSKATAVMINPFKYSTYIYWCIVATRYTITTVKCSHIYGVSKIHLTFDHNFGKCTPIYKILSLLDCWGNFVHRYHNDSPLTLSMFLYTLWNLKITIMLPISMAYCVYVRHQNSPCKIWGRLSSSGMNPMTIKPGKQCISAQKICDVTLSVN